MDGWAIVQGFAGMHIINDMLCFHPVIPEKWNRYQFNLNFRERTLQVTIEKTAVKIVLLKGESAEHTG